MSMTVKQARRMAEITQAEMAKELEIDRSTYIKIEKDPDRATVSQAKKISAITRVPIDRLFLA